MWKKMFVVLLALLGSLSVVFAINQELSANSKQYNAGGNVTGRIGYKGTFPDGNHGAMEKGDSVLFSENSPEGIPLAWRLAQNKSSNAANPGSIKLDGSPIYGFTMAPGSAITYDETTWHALSTYLWGPTVWGKELLYRNSNVRKVIDNLNQQVSNNAIENKLIKDRLIFKIFNQGGSSVNFIDYTETRIFVFHSVYEVNSGYAGSGQGVGLKAPDFAMKDCTSYRGTVQNGDTNTTHGVICSNGNQFGEGNLPEVSDPYRLATFLDLQNVVFAVSNGTTLGSANVTQPKFTDGSLMTTAVGDDMKLRLLDTTKSADLQDILIGNVSVFTKQGLTFYDTIKLNNNSIVKLKVNAQNGLNTNATNTISILVFDENNNFIRYMPIQEAIEGINEYSLDLSALNLPADKIYKIEVVNEDYNEQSNGPTYSSALSAPLSIEVVDKLKITYTASSSKYTYNDNAKGGNIIGDIKFEKGIPPYQAELVAGENGDDSYLNFELTQNDSITDSASVKIKSDALALSSSTNSLKAGTYKFCVVAKESDSSLNSSTVESMLCHTLVVEKAQPNVEFTSNDKGTIIVKGEATNTVTHNEQATHSNKDTPANDVGIIYSIVSDPSSIIQSGLPFTSTSVGDVASIIFKANISGTVEIQACIPESDNYKEAKTNKTINLQLGLTGNYVEDKKSIIAGSNAAKPPISYSQDNRIGHISVLGGNSPFSYSLPSGKGNNSSFYIDTSGNIYVKQSVVNGLLVGDYTIEVEITDSTTPTAQTTTFKKTITIKPATLSVKFEDPDDSSKTVENVITRTYDPSSNPAGGSFHTRLVETTEGSLTGAKIDYSVEADPNDVLEYVDRSGDYANFKVKKASSAAEKNQIKIKATVSGGYYGSEGTDITILVNVEQYKQEIEFKQTNPYPLPNTSQCTSIAATKKSTYWNQSTTNEIKYTSSDITKATIDADGKVRPVKGATGSITLTAVLAGDDNYTKASTTIKINLLGELTLTYTEDEPIKQAVNPDKTGDTGNAKDGAEFGSIRVAGGLDKRYDIQIKNDDYAYPYFELAAIDGNERASTLKLKSGVSITADILKAGIDAGVIEQDSTNKDQYNWTIQVLPDTETEPQEIIVHIIGADPILTFEKEVEGKLTTTYQKDGTIDLSVKRGNTVLSTGIRIEGTTGYLAFIDSLANLTTDAQVNGIKIKKANCDNEDNVIAGKNIKVTPKAEASDGYKSGTGTATPVIIKKAEHPEVDFVDPDTILQSGVSSVDKGITGIEPNDAHLTITPKDPSTWEGTTFEKIDSNHDVEPSVTIKPNGYEGAVIYVVNGGGTDNYKPIVDKEIDLFFSSTGGITYKPIKITYGDNTKKVIDYITDGDKDKNTYSYQPVEGSTYVDEENNEILTLNDESTITTIQAGKTKVNVTREDTEGNILTQAIPVEVIPKEITLTYASNTIYTGEALPAPTFLEPENGVFVGSDTLTDFPIPADAGHYKGTESITDSETTGTYDTKGSWTKDELATEVNPNYKVIIKAGKLTIKKDTVKDSWYHLEDPEGNTISKNDWHDYIVDVVLDTATGTAGTYDQISNTKTFTNVDRTRFTVTKEDENTEDVYFRIDPDSEVEHKGAITSTQTIIKIDITNPNVTKITGYPVNTDGLSELIHNLTFGMFFKPGVEILIETKDPQPSGETGITVSGVHTVSYKIYKLDDKGGFDSTQTPKTGEGKVDANGKISFKINDVGNYRICAIAKDNASNSSNESCSDLNVKKIDEDIDEDGEPDFNDSDNDGCPDLNIVLGTDTAGNKIKLNVAEKGKSYPYMNIDSNGDGKPDLNIDTDHDGRPDLNLVDLSKETTEGGLSAWNPKTCVVIEKLKDYSDPIEYCTGTDAKPLINVVVDNGKEDIKDQIPSLNIDNNGDMEPDLNISKDGKEPYLNIVKLHEWKPNSDYTKDSFFYDSIGTGKDDPKREINIDTNGDSYPDVNVDLNNDGKPDINIDMDGDEVPDIDIDTKGDGKPDKNIDTNGDGKPDENIIDISEWKPEKIVDGDIPYGTMEIKGKTEIEDNGIIVEKPSGEFLPNSAIKVKDISDKIDTSTKSQLDKVAKNQEVKKVYDVEYLENNTAKQPDGKVNVKIPIDPQIKNAKVVIEKEDGSFEEVSYAERDGYYVFETEYIGKVSVIGDVEKTTEPDPKPTPDPEPTTKPDSEQKNPNTSVQGNYTTQDGTTSGVGGAYTGDETNAISLFMISTVSLAILLGIGRRKHQMK